MKSTRQYKTKFFAIRIYLRLRQDMFPRIFNINKIFLQILFCLKFYAILTL